MEIFGPSPLVRLGKSASNLFRKNGMPIFELRVGSIHAKMSTTLKEEKFYHAECYKYLVLARDFVEIPDSDSLDLVEGLTVEMWLYLEAWSTAGGTGATKELSYKVGPRDNKKVLIRLTTDKQAWGAAVVHGKTEMPLKKWMHVAGTYDGKSGQVPKSKDLGLLRVLTSLSVYR